MHPTEDEMARYNLGNRNRLWARHGREATEAARPMAALRASTGCPKVHPNARRRNITGTKALIIISKYFISMI
jgi:hypothetical protein